MGGDIHLKICGDVLKAKNANWESRAKPVCWIFYIDIIDIPGTQYRAGIRHVSEGAKCRQRSV